MPPIKKRTLHLYLSCFFAPALIFFILTGVIQMLNLHHKQKDGSYVPPKFIEKLSMVHFDQRYAMPNEHEHSFPPFRYFAFAMAAGFIVTTLLGIQLAFESRSNSRAALLCLIFGALVPIVILYLNRS